MALHTATKTASSVSPGQAQEKLKNVFGSSVDVSLDASPKGNRSWRIDIELHDMAELKLPRLPLAPLCGFLACHKTGSFTAYVVNVADSELWFDHVDPALDLLAASLKR